MVGRPFIVRTDQENLKYLLEQKIGTPTQQKWFAKLLGYASMVQYKKGKDNLVTDALSRKVENEDDLAVDVLSSKSKSVNLTFEDDLDC